MCIGQIKAEQKPFTTEALRRGVLPLFFSVSSRLSGSKSVQPILDHYRKSKRFFNFLNFFFKNLRVLRLSPALRAGASVAVRKAFLQ